MQVRLRKRGFGLKEGVGCIQGRLRKGGFALPWPCAHDGSVKRIVMV